MDRTQIVDAIRNNPAAAEEGRKRMEGVLARSASDTAFRAQLISQPRAALSSYFGTEIPELDVVFIENKAAATIVLPDFVDTAAELSESELEAVAGGSEPVTLGAIAVGIAIGSALTVIGYELTHR